MGPLNGIRIVEFAGIGPAPFGAMLLSDLGADVITIHRASTVDAPVADPVAKMTQGTLSRGRRSIAVDLKDGEGRETVLRLVESADALIEGFRPGVMERLGLGPGDCHARNPALVYGRMTGWGQSGPFAHAAGHDINYIALSGALAHVGRKDRPVPPLNLVADFGGGGMLLALGIVSALLEASHSGQGQVVDAAMLDGSALLMTMMYELLARGQWKEQRECNMIDGGAPFYDVYETSDGKHVAVGAMEPRFYAELLAKLELDASALPEQWDDTRWPELKEALRDVFRTRTQQEWCTLLDGTDACVTPVLTMTEAMDHPQNIARGTFTKVGGVAQPAPAPRFSRTPARIRRTPVGPGADTDKVLGELGYTAESIADLRARGVVA